MISQTFDKGKWRPRVRAFLAETEKEMLNLIGELEKAEVAGNVIDAG